MTARSRYGLWLLLVLPFFSSSAQVPSPNLNSLASQISDQVRAAKVKSIVVADFVYPDGSAGTLGRYLAGSISAILETRLEKTRVVDRVRVSDTLRNLFPAMSDASQMDVVRRFGKSLDARCVLLGVIHKEKEHYKLDLVARSAEDDRIIGNASESFPTSSFLDKLDPKSDNPAVPAQSLAASSAGHVPQCIFCLDPEYSDAARNAQIGGITILDVLVTPDGQVARVQVRTELGHGLTERAIETVSTWRLRPALGTSQEPIAVQIPVEVTFRISSGRHRIN